MHILLQRERRRSKCRSERYTSVFPQFEPCWCHPTFPCILSPWAWPLWQAMQAVHSVTHLPLLYTEAKRNIFQNPWQGQTVGLECDLFGTAWLHCRFLVGKGMVHGVVILLKGFGYELQEVRIYKWAQPVKVNENAKEVPTHWGLTVWILPLMGCSGQGNCDAIVDLLAVLGCLYPSNCFILE